MRPASVSCHFDGHVNPSKACRRLTELDSIAILASALHRILFILLPPSVAQTPFTSVFLVANYHSITLISPNHQHNRKYLSRFISCISFAMEGDLINDSSSNYSSQHQPMSFGSHGQISILASCYMASTVSKTVQGFHYCTPNGAGM